VFAGLMVRHATQLGYLSGRHALSLALAGTPWAAAGLRAAAARVSGWMRLGPARASRLRVAGVVAMVAVGVSAQLRPAHASRWGNREAGRWISRHAGAGEAVLDTRGWAAFVSGQPSYDYWHVRQALSDGNLGYIVVGRDELEARSGRAESLRALLAMTGRLAASFPAREGGRGADVLVYRFGRPQAWGAPGR
jgi:hypothetical protein